MYAIFIRKSLKSILFLAIASFSVGCGDSDLGRLTGGPVFSTFFNNRMLLLLKGTYSTDNPIEFSDYNGGTGQLYQDDFGDEKGPPHNTNALPSAAGLPILLDFGEIRVSTKFQKGINELTQIRDPLDSEDFWDFIASERQVYCTTTYSLEEDTCQKQGGLFKAQEFFNGNGAIFPSNDPTSQTYDCSNPEFLAQCLGIGLTPQDILGTQYWYTGIYFRSMVTGWAIQNGGQLFDQARFDNRRVPGLNIVPRNNYEPRSTDADKQQIVPKLFPLLYSVQGTHRDMQIRGGIDPIILEVRMNMKENLMVHTIDRLGGFRESLVSFSDWNVDNRGEPDIGGNLLLRSRVIYPEFAASLNITGGQGNLRYYYGVYHSDETELRKQLPLAATPARSSASIKYLNPGKYKLYCIGDTERVDGFPETIIRQTEFVVNQEDRRTTINVELACP
jgi:hypothetical protein